ncbi:MAG: EAL domain-containing protein [Rugosibacter sp.]|nr:MAG: EAL domain-containing protein [Rugosibacter sp.]TBR06816.1 MAG: EAL domain-containing protein [Rugosibacter sp.]
MERSRDRIGSTHSVHFAVGRDWPDPGNRRLGFAPCRTGSRSLAGSRLQQRDFVKLVQRAVEELGGKGCGLDLEITGSLIMEDIESNIRKLKAIRDMGLNIVIDDFGTGYSSLAYLAKLPVHALKIDRSFIITMLDNSDSMTLVSTIISLAHSLRLKVVAEGVDQEVQAKILRLLRCDEMQGHLFSRPIPFDEMSALIGNSGTLETGG